MKLFKKISSWFKKHPELSGEQTVEPIIEVDPYTKAQKLLRCSTSCTGLDCSHHYDPDRIVEKVVTLVDGTNLLISGKEFIDGPPYYVEGEPILASEIWNEGSLAIDVSSTKASRYTVDDLPDSGVEGDPIWVEGKDPYLIGGVPDEVSVPPGKKYTALGGYLIDDHNYGGNKVKINKVREFTETRSLGELSNDVTKLIQGPTGNVDAGNPFLAVEESEFISPTEQYDQSDPLFVTDIAEENNGN